MTSPRMDPRRESPSQTAQPSAWRRPVPSRARNWPRWYSSPRLSDDKETIQGLLRLFTCQTRPAPTVCVTDTKPCLIIEQETPDATNLGSFRFRTLRSRLWL
jgi:hypothetical protein